MKRSSFVVVSFYTRDTGYEIEIQDRLIPSLEELGVAHDVVGVESRGTWRLNIFQKPYVIRDMLAKHAGTNIVWLDSDAVLVRRPEAFDCTQADFACHFRWGRKLSSGTMFFRNNDRIKNLVEDWISTIEMHPDLGETTEQKLLHSILPHHPEIEVDELPLAYSMIFDGEQISDPVVVHYQASRRLRDDLDERR
jgi:hypothetical protein